MANITPVQLFPGYQLAGATAISATILGAIGAKPLSLISSGVCGESISGDARRLVFYRDDGSSMSVPVANRGFLDSAANVVKGVLISSGRKVTCIKLVGEYWSNLNDELGLSYTAGTVAPTHRSVGNGKQHYYTGIMTYQSDAYKASAQSNQFLLKVKSISDLENAPASQIGTQVWNGCVGELSKAAFSCGGKQRNKRRHRRFLLDFATAVSGNVITEVESIELPHKNSDASSIATCGQAAAVLPGIVCIGYRGESYSRFNTVI
jgi:hypothetical protein